MGWVVLEPVLEGTRMVFGWKCPCGFQNQHNGHSNKITDEEAEYIQQMTEQIKEETEQDIAEDIGVDPDELDLNVVALKVPDFVWCVKCEQKHNVLTPNTAGFIDIPKDDDDDY